MKLFSLYTHTHASHFTIISAMINLESLEERFESIPSDSPEKRFRIITLTKNASNGLGLKLVGGRSGLFVLSISAGGPADLEGSIHVGDRLVAINGRNAECEYGTLFLFLMLSAISKWFSMHIHRPLALLPSFHCDSVGQGTLYSSVDGTTP